MNLEKRDPTVNDDLLLRGACLECGDEWSEWADQGGIAVCPECGSLAVEDITGDEA